MDYRDISFSVLLSVYAKENSNYLNEALTSIWDQQSLKPDQIVLVKDGLLTDELNKKINIWKKKLGEVFTIVELPKNVGLGAALNYGLKQCNHEIVARMDTDDISLPDRFEKQIEYLKLNPDIVLLSGYIKEFQNKPDDKCYIRKVPLEYYKIIKYLKWRNAFNHVTVFFKKSAVLAVGGYNSIITYFEDYDLWIRLVQAQYRVSNIPEILVNVRIGNNMIGRRHGIAYTKKEISFLYMQKKKGFLSLFDYYLLIFLRIPLRLIPKNILSLLYLLLRNN